MAVRRDFHGRPDSQEQAAARRAMPLLTSLLAMVMVASSLILAGPIASADVLDSHDRVVSEFSTFNVPDVLDGRVEAIATVGNTVVVGGDFTQVRSPGGATLDMPYLFAFDKTTGQIDTGFAPDLNNKVFALEGGGDGASVFVGGAFTTVDGLFNKKGVTKLDLDGRRIADFRARTDGRVKTMVRLGDVLYFGGTFSKVGSIEVGHLAAVDVTTGELLPTFDSTFSGEYSTCLLYTSPSPRDATLSRMPSSA